MRLKSVEKNAGLISARSKAKDVVKALDVKFKDLSVYEELVHEALVTALG